MSRETWVPVFKYENLYEISSKGRVRSKRQEIKDKTGNLVRGVEPFFGEIKKTDQTPYPYVVLTDGKKYHKENVKYLLDESFAITE